MGISFAAMISMLTTQHKQGKAIQQQLASASLKYGILQTLRNPENCLCQFNSLPSTPHTIDTTKTTSGGEGYEIDLGEFRSGCGPGDDNILARQDEPIKGGAGLGAQSVKVSQIFDTGTPNEFKGNLQVMYQSQSTVMSLRTLSVPVLFTVDPNQGTENARPISDCGVKTDVSTRLADLDDRITDLEDIMDLFDPTTQDQSCTPALATATQTLAAQGYSKSSCASGYNKVGSKEAEFKFAVAGGCVTAMVTKVKCRYINRGGSGGGSECSEWLYVGGKYVLTPSLCGGDPRDDEPLF